MSRNLEQVQAEPRDLEEALELLRRRPEMRVLAGGTAPLPAASTPDDASRPVLSVMGVAELHRLDIEDELVRIGPAVGLEELGARTEPELALLAAAATSMSTPPDVRSRATVGGNLLWAHPGADLVPVLEALAARVCLVSLDSEREMAVNKLITGPEQTLIRPDELLLEIFFPTPRRCGFGYAKRAEGDDARSPRLSAAAVLQFGADETIDAASIGVGGVTATPERGRHLEMELRGKRPDPDSFRQAAAHLARWIFSVKEARWELRFSPGDVEEIVLQALCKAGGCQHPAA
jgi:CO/xanthine dehydrogenase FAD-binding subunit